MSVFFQHVGEAGGARDFPKTIGTVAAGLRQFELSKILPKLRHLPLDEVEQLQRDISRYAPDGFQIWGIPSGAKAVLRELQVGDYLLLLEAAGVGGSFAYAGRVVAKPRSECFELSGDLWGEQRFPLILFLKGSLTNFSWVRFCERLGYKPNWNPAGNTYRVPPQRIITSAFVDEDGLIRSVVGHPISMNHLGMALEVPFQDEAELDFQDEEGREILRQHLHRERSAKLVRKFKSGLTDFSCKVCGFDFLKVYGELGRGYIEAHHIKPLATLKPDETVRVQDLLPVCSNCHRMLHRRFPNIEWSELKDILVSAFAQHRRH
jgi:5-methylcytosine-specific restriction protein A